MTLLSLPTLVRTLASNVFLVDGCPAALYLNDLTYADDHTFLFVAWIDAENREFSAAFAEGVNRQVASDADALHIVDTDGEIIYLTYAARPVCV